MTKTSTASSPTTPKRTVTKSTASASKTRARAVQESPLPEPAVPPTPDLLAVVTERLNVLEEKIAGGLSSLTAEIHTLKPDPGLPSPDGTVTSETFLPVVADLIRRNLMEQVNPVIASLKRLEERVGFISNRLKQPPPAGPDHRQKPWRHEQQQRHNRPRGPRPGGEVAATVEDSRDKRGPHLLPLPFKVILPRVLYVVGRADSRKMMRSNLFLLCGLVLFPYFSLCGITVTKRPHPRLRVKET